MVDLDAPFGISVRIMTEMMMKRKKEGERV